MVQETQLQTRIQGEWDRYNQDGVILYREDTLSVRRAQHDKVELMLIHNACRDVYDRSQKSIDRPAGTAVPFADGSNPELATTDDDRFKILGNRFACMQYQSVLTPVKPLTDISVDFFVQSLKFAKEYPELTLMYNAINAGKTVPNQYWLLSFHAYEALAAPTDSDQLIGYIDGRPIRKRMKPCYLVTFQIGDQIESSAGILFKMVMYLGEKNFNIFLFNDRVFFIPREDVEIPTGFGNHRFGGLEMIGFFVMKSVEMLRSANPAQLVDGIREISYGERNQARFEEFLLQEL